MKINNLTLKSMLVATGLSLALGCESKPVVETKQTITPTKPTEISTKPTDTLSNGSKPIAPTPISPRRITYDYCPPCGRG